ncbi:TPA: hypothetical protein H1005_00480, partial [archaeon]|nr:hypothetical protein [Candidatus Naiadarchaeales archaeon SRR2090153.bin1042]
TAWKHVDYTPYLYHSITAADGIPGLQKNTQYDVKVSAILDTAFGPMIIKDSNTLTVITYNY